VSRGLVATIERQVRRTLGRLGIRLSFLTNILFLMRQGQ